MMVKSIDSGGFIRFMSWDLDKRMLPAKLVRVGEKKTLGIIGIKPVHTLKPDEKQSYLETTQLYIDIGANSKEEAAKLVSVGEYVGLEVEFAPFGEEKVVGRALESRVGCARHSTCATERGMHGRKKDYCCLLRTEANGDAWFYRGGQRLTSGYRHQCRRRLL